MTNLSAKEKAAADFLLDLEEDEEAATPPATPLARLLRLGKRKRFWAAIIFAICIGVMMVLYRQGYLRPEVVLSVLHAYPVAAPLIFFAIYFVMVVFLLPTLPLNLAAGMLWGPALGSILSVAAAAAGASISFIAARHLVSEFLNTRFNGSAWRWLKSEIAQADWKAVAFVRINPVFPFGPLNYFFGLTDIRFARYFWSTLIFVAPPSVAIAVVGHAVGGFVLRGSAEGWMENILLISAAVTVVVAARFGMRYLVARRQSQSSDIAIGKIV